MVSEDGGRLNNGTEHYESTKNRVSRRETTFRGFQQPSSEFYKCWCARQCKGT